jgi:hypothetical protein
MKVKVDRNTGATIMRVMMSITDDLDVIDELITEKNGLRGFQKDKIKSVRFKLRTALMVLSDIYYGGEDVIEQE